MLIENNGDKLMEESLEEQKPKKGMCLRNACERLGVDLENCRGFGYYSEFLTERYRWLMGDKVAEEMWGGGSADGNIEESDLVEGNGGLGGGADEEGGFSEEFDFSQGFELGTGLDDQEVARLLGVLDGDLDVVHRVAIILELEDRALNHDGVRGLYVQLFREEYDDEMWAAVRQVVDRVVARLFFEDEEVRGAVREHLENKKFGYIDVAQTLVMAGCNELWVLDAYAESWLVNWDEFPVDALRAGVRMGDVYARMGKDVVNDSERFFRFIEWVEGYLNADDPLGRFFEGNFVLDEIGVRVLRFFGEADNFDKLNDLGKLRLLALVVQNPQFLIEYFEVIEESVLGEILQELMGKLVEVFRNEDWVNGPSGCVRDLVIEKLGISEERSGCITKIFRVLGGQYGKFVGEELAEKMWFDGGEDEPGEGEFDKSGNNILAGNEALLSVALNNARRAIQSGQLHSCRNSLKVLSALIADLTEVKDFFIEIMDLEFRELNFSGVELSDGGSVSQFIYDLRVMAVGYLADHLVDDQVWDCFMKGLDSLPELRPVLLMKLFDNGFRDEWVIQDLVKYDREFFNDDDLGVEINYRLMQVFSVRELVEKLEIKADGDDWECFYYEVSRGAINVFVECDEECCLRFLELNQDEVGIFLETLFDSKNYISSHDYEEITLLVCLVSNPEFLDVVIGRCSGSERSEFIQVLWLVKSYYTRAKLINWFQKRSDNMQRILVELEDVAYIFLDEFGD